MQQSHSMDEGLADRVETRSPSTLAARRQRFLEQRRAFWDRMAGNTGRRSIASRRYHRRLEEVYRFLVPRGSRVVELGCGYGDLVASVEPSYGVGVDYSAEMIRIAKQRHPHLTFTTGLAEDIAANETFDVIILSDLICDLWDIQECMDRCRALSHPGTRVIINSYSRLWQIPMAAARSLRLASPVQEQNWFAMEDIHNLVRLSGFEPVRAWTEVILPFPIPLLAPFMDRVAVRFWPWRQMALSCFVVACPAPVRGAGADAPSVSIVVPARNEAGNIGDIVRRTPLLGSSTELIFVEGHSTDKTYEAIEQVIRDCPDRKITLFRQTGVGKADAVRLGFSKARGDILMILDADMTVAPECLPRFYDALVSGKGEFINGVRLVYPMAEDAMRFCNLVANKFFSLSFSWVLGQDVKDTLCGTKVLWKRDYERIAANRHYFGDFDPFGDFDLIFGAAKLNLRIVDMPVRYQERTYGTTNISRWKHGCLLLRMLAFAARRLKFQ